MIVLLCKKLLTSIVFALSVLYLMTGCQQNPRQDIMPVLLLIPHYPLPQEDKDFFKRINPYGFVLSIPKHRDMDPNQLRRELEDVLGRKDFLFFLDQEGGSVNRLRNFDSSFYSPAASHFGDIAQNDFDFAVAQALKEGGRTGRKLKSYGIDVVFAPVADVIDREDIFRRSRFYAVNPQVSKALADAFARGLADAGVVPCYKHFPGFGDKVDSHKTIPVINASLAEITSQMKPAFQESKKYGCLMTGHALYKSLDEQNVSSYSAKLYRLARKTLGFKGIIIADALNMVAAGGPKTNDLGERMNKAFAAGTDVVMPFFRTYESPEKKEEILRQIDPKYIKRFQRRARLIKHQGLNH